MRTRGVSGRVLKDKAPLSLPQALPLLAPGAVAAAADYTLTQFRYNGTEIAQPGTMPPRRLAAPSRLARSSRSSTKPCPPKRFVQGNLLHPSDPKRPAHGRAREVEAGPGGVVEVAGEDVEC